MSEWKKLGGLKVGQTKEGDFMLYGRFTYNLNMVIVPNKYKEGEGDPDYVILVAESDRQNNTTARQPGQHTYTTPAPPQNPKTKPPYYRQNNKGGKGKIPGERYTGDTAEQEIPFPPGEGEPF